MTAALQQPIFRAGKGPLLDLEDHVAIESNRARKGGFDPFVEIGNN